MLMPRVFRTIWGDISPNVDVFPVGFVAFVYGFIYFLPGRFFFRVFHGDDGPIEWLQVVVLGVAVIFSLASAWRVRRRLRCWQAWAWVGLALMCFLLLAEEISWGERLMPAISNSTLKQINVQGETNLHNLQGINSLLHLSYILFGIGLGYVGWRFFPGIDCLPPRSLSLYFLPLALFAAYLDLSWFANLERIRNDQEVFEFLAFVGLAVNGWRGFVAPSKIT